VEKSKQSEPLKDEGELWLKRIQEETYIWVSLSHKLQGMPKDRRKKLELEKIFYENVA
jgi:hypothetical protein